MKATVKLLVNDRIKELTIQRDTADGLKSWIIKMMDNSAFVIGELEDGSWAAGDIFNIRRATEAGLL